MKLLGTDHPFFKPLWIRIAVVAFTSAWTALELWYGNTGWATLVGVFTLLSIYGFFFDFKPDGDDAPAGRSREE